MGRPSVPHRPPPGINSTSPEIVNSNMNVNTIDVEWIPRLYYIFVGSAVAVFTVINALEHLLFRKRISALRQSTKSKTPQPENGFWRLFATQTAFAREISNISLKPLRIRRLTIFFPTGGQVFLIAANFIFVIILCFYKLPPHQYSQFQNIGYRCAFVSLPQLTLIFILSAKNNIVGYLTGMSYERLNYLHRWFARTLLVTVTIHMAYWLANWAPYDYISVMILNDPTTQRGMAAWFILVWIVLSSFTPVRGWNYEFFVVQHLVSYVVFMTVVFLHTPSTDHEWLWAPVAIWVIDHLCRYARVVYINLAILHPRKRKIGVFAKEWACKANLTAFPDGITRITIPNPPITWSSGQHAIISCQSIALFQNHPFTIASNRTDGKLEFFVRAHKGATQRIFRCAHGSVALPSARDTSIGPTVPLIISEPYGKLRPLRQFDSVVFLAGSIGATFTVPLLRDLVYELRAAAGIAPTHSGFMSRFKAPNGAVTRRIRFIWVVKYQGQLTWFADQLWQVLDQVDELRTAGAGATVDMSFYMTRDPCFTKCTQSAVIAKEPTARNEPPTVEYGDIFGFDGSGPEELSLESNCNQNTALEKDVEKIRVRAGQVESINRDFEAEKKSKGVKVCYATSGTCCRQTMLVHKISETDTSSGALQAICSCESDEGESSLDSDEEKPNEKNGNPVRIHPRIATLSGRPHPKSIIRGAVERARGETAVVTCGPKGLIDDARRSAVDLSSETAVHQGNLTRGIWFWGEGFSY